MIFLIFSSSGEDTELGQVGKEQAQGETGGANVIYTDWIP